MPLRTVLGVDYSQAYTGRPMLSIDVQVDEEDEPHEMVLDLETDEDVQKAAAYLSSCFVPTYSTCRSHARTLYACPRRRAVITAPALIHELVFRDCDFENSDEDVLSLTLRGIVFHRLAFIGLPIPAWQVTDKLLESLRLRGCNEFSEVSYNAGVVEKSGVTEEGIISYCFTLTDNLRMPDWRFLQIECLNITPSFFKKVVQASKNSKLTCNVQLWLYDLQFDVSKLDIGVPPSRSLVANRDGQIHFRSYRSYGDEKWDVIVRHGKKDRREEPYLNYFKPEPEEEQDEGVAP